MPAKHLGPSGHRGRLTDTPYVDFHRPHVGRRNAPKNCRRFTIRLPVLWTPVRKARKGGNAWLIWKGSFEGATPAGPGGGTPGSCWGVEWAFWGVSKRPG